MKDVVEAYDHFGFGRRIGFGEKPALIVVDFVRACTDPSTGSVAFDLTEAIAQSNRVLKVFREKGLPVIFSKVVFSKNLIDGGLFVQKVPTLQHQLEGTAGIEFDPRILPTDDDIVIVKKYPSVFFGTTLASILLSLRVDTTVIVGNSTSGCVRATCVDSISNGLRPIIPRECVGDRDPDIHERNLFDMDSKYGDVMLTDDVIAYINSHY